VASKEVVLVDSVVCSLVELSSHSGEVLCGDDLTVCFPFLVHDLKVFPRDGSGQEARGDGALRTWEYCAYLILGGLSSDSEQFCELLEGSSDNPSSGHEASTGRVMHNHTDLGVRTGRFCNAGWLGCSLPVGESEVVGIFLCAQLVAVRLQELRRLGGVERAKLLDDGGRDGEEIHEWLPLPERSVVGLADFFH
jgi:hypothetical protein